MGEDGGSKFGRKSSISNFGVAAAKIVSKMKVKLADLNSFLTCCICGGYLINATTITECVHTFCRSCLLQHIKSSNKCPSCNGIIHPSQPLKSLRPDQTMQDIVYKLVPGLRENEEKREIEFNQKAGLPTKKNSPQTNDKAVSDYVKKNYAGGIRIKDHQPICMEGVSERVPSLERKFMMVPLRSTILHLKKFLASKILNDIDKWGNVDIYCNGELMGKEHSIEFVFVTKWRRQNPILVLQYSC
ncbi:hypothetical protein GE061_011990 [Apolygus lucorum]|uniref:RING-type domain-containing protein n=1 Tax=Apolygus lucorum TaxID=248454 RepID=A0A8S9XTB7_APOLU|nr:hypothetical protein GE061_011990 [Apolygus lucorum]